MFSFTIRSLLLQFFREYTGKVDEYTAKVDELVKDKIEAEKKLKEKENEEKKVVAKKVISFAIFCSPSINFCSALMLAV